MLSGCATPTALLVGTGRGAQLGILIKGPEILESTQKIDTVVLDKTGTVTTGQMELIDVVVADGVDGAQARRTVAALESGSEHPIARAIVAGVERNGVSASVPGVHDFANREGLGVVATVDGVRAVAGRPRLLADEGLLGARSSWSRHDSPRNSSVAPRSPQVGRVPPARSSSLRTPPRPPAPRRSRR